VSAAGDGQLSATVAAEHRGGTGTPLLLLHGLTASFRVWQPVFEPLERHHEVIAPTLAGHYGGAALAAGVVPSVASLTDAVERRLDELEIARPHVAGNSLGGIISLELARRGRARSVVAFSPPATWASDSDFLRVSMIVWSGHLAAGRSGPSVRGLLARPRSRRLLLRVACEHGERVPPAAAESMLADSAAYASLSEFLRAVRHDGPMVSPVEVPDCPIRIAWPLRDRTVPFERYGRPLLKVVPGAELVRLDGVGHVPMYDDPVLVVRTILEVTEAVDAAAVDAAAGAGATGARSG
jgi:pimeloyl-ACP methyl ester carboxylesterase